jgi:anti-anti-sigma factor
MLTSFQDENYIEFKFSSEIKMVNRIIKDIRSFLQNYGVEEDSNIILILRELINNAIEHGNKKEKDLIVSVSITHLSDKRFKIVVEDEGDGFDFNSINYRMSDDPTQIRNRGLCLVNSFSDEIEFNEFGNMITVYAAANESTQFHVEEKDDWIIVRPSGDITAEESDNFRLVMHDCLEQKKTKFRFDLSHVNEVDSIGLSLFVIFSNMARKQTFDIGLEIVNANQELANLFQMTRLNRIYEIIE